jgi:predicted acyltransferase
LVYDPGQQCGSGLGYFGTCAMVRLGLDLLFNTHNLEFRNGVTIADFVMPTFLFIVGASIAIAFNGALEREESKAALLKRAFVRTCKLFAMGLFLQGGNFPYFDLSTLRVMGVLQRIAICYFIVSALFIFAPRMCVSEFC